jgi:hypothetical protein
MAMTRKEFENAKSVKVSNGAADYYLTSHRENFSQPCVADFTCGEMHIENCIVSNIDDSCFDITVIIQGMTFDRRDYLQFCQLVDIVPNRELKKY